MVAVLVATADSHLLQVKEEMTDDLRCPFCEFVVEPVIEDIILTCRCGAGEIMWW